MAFAAALLAMSGCTWSPEASPATDFSTPAALDQQTVPVTTLPPGGVPGIDTPDQVSRPIDVYLASVDEVIQITQVQNARQEACFAEHGSSSKIEERPAGSYRPILESHTRDWAMNSGPWGFFADREQAAKDGYRLTEELGSSTMGPQPELSEEVRDACVQLDTIQNPPSSLLFAYSLPDGGPADASIQPAFLKAIESWGSCMKERGFAYRSPRDAQEGPPWNFSKPLTVEETSTAVADLDCKDETNVIGVGLELQRQLDEQYIADHREDLADFRANIDLLLRG